jgi:hypothetical protein
MEKNMNEEDVKFVKTRNTVTIYVSPERLQQHQRRHFSFLPPKSPWTLAVVGIILASYGAVVLVVWLLESFISQEISDALGVWLYESIPKAATTFVIFHVFAAVFLFYFP